MALSSFPLENTLRSRTNEHVKDEGVKRDRMAAAAEPEFRNARRVQESFTARIEKEALLWIAARLPLWVTSDQLTFFGLGAMLFGWGSYLLARWYRAGFLLATLSLALNWFGDSLDGTLARVRDLQRPRYGFYVDHVIDSIGAALLMSGLALSGCLDWRIAAAMLVGFLLLSIESYLASYTIGVFRMSFWKFGPTEIRILLALGNLALWSDPQATVFGRVRLFDFGGVIASALMLAMFIASAVRHTAHLYRQERLVKSKAERSARHEPLF
ncbi:MAG TPA: CDP-alcohol phosphatidyltransferase family protein [Candidatus Acidoferrum sp.]|nr:CDP-alcohol phosphatidyltransferase family protein [Candidatus Acidoferrum sp.]